MSLAIEYPKQFLSSLRTLFDILDEERNGFILVGDIERRWRGSSSEDGLPQGVMESLRRTASADGKLTFELFVRGLRDALKRTSKEDFPASANRSVQSHRNTNLNETVPTVHDTERHGNRPDIISHSTPTSPVRGMQPPEDHRRNQQSYPNAVQPSLRSYTSAPNFPAPEGLLSKQRTTSMPQLMAIEEQPTAMAVTYEKQNEPPREIRRQASRKENSSESYMQWRRGPVQGNTSNNNTIVYSCSIALLSTHLCEHTPSTLQILPVEYHEHLYPPTPTQLVNGAYNLKPGYRVRVMGDRVSVRNNSGNNLLSKFCIANKLQL